MIAGQNVDVVMLDLKLHGVDGVEVLRELEARRPETEVIVVTANGNVETAVEAMKSGAFDYVTKPSTLEQLKLLLERVSTHLGLKTEKRFD
jgi:DNA-binding NtrC family response regulator